MDNVTVVVGLGNPGLKYELTRHNVGFLAIDYLSRKYDIAVNKVKFKAILGEGFIEGGKVLLVKPQTFMNASGESVREIVEWYRIPLEKLVVIYDDIDIDTGIIRVRPAGSAGTHNGMRSILYHLQSEAFPRIRIGIGKPPQGWDLADYVLSRFLEEEKKAVFESIEAAAGAVGAIMESGINAAMNTFNGKR